MTLRRDAFARAYLLYSGLVIAALIAGFAVLLVQVIAVNRAQHASDIQQCRVANAARAQDIAIWNRLLAIPPGTPATAAQRAEVAGLERLVRVKDAPRDCAQAYRS